MSGIERPSIEGGRGMKEEAMSDIEKRLELAERVCLMFGWTAASDTDRGKAAHELWLEWLDVYRAAGGSTNPGDHPELSDERIAELAARRDATVARTIGRIREAVESQP